MPARGSARDRIVETYYRMLAERGRRGVVPKRLYSEAGVNRTTFYYHFRGIEDLERQVVGEFMDGVFAAGLAPTQVAPEQMVPGSEDALVRAGWRGIVTFVYEHADHATTLIRAGFQDMMLETYMEAYRSMPEAPLFTFDTPEGSAPASVVGILNGFNVIHCAYNALSCIDFLVRRGFRDPIEQVTDAFFHSFGARIRTM